MRLGFSGFQTFFVIGFTGVGNIGGVTTTGFPEDHPPPPPPQPPGPLTIGDTGVGEGQRSAIVTIVTSQTFTVRDTVFATFHATSLAEYTRI